MAENSKILPVATKVIIKNSGKAGRVKSTFRQRNNLKWFHVVDSLSGFPLGDYEIHQLGVVPGHQ